MDYQVTRTTTRASKKFSRLRANSLCPFFFFFLITHHLGQKRFGYGVEWASSGDVHHNRLKDHRVLEKGMKQGSPYFPRISSSGVLSLSLSLSGESRATTEPPMTKSSIIFYLYFFLLACLVLSVSMHCHPFSLHSW